MVSFWGAQAVTTGWTAGMDLAQLRACIARFEEDCASLRTQLAAKDREIAALREALIDARIFAVNWRDDRYVNKAMALLVKIEAALSGAPAPAPAEDQSEYGPMVYGDQTQPTVYPSASVRAPDPAEAMRAKCDEAVAAHTQPEDSTLYKLASPEEQAIMRACNRLVVNIRFAIASAALKGNGEKTEKENGNG